MKSRWLHSHGRRGKEGGQKAPFTRLPLKKGPDSTTKTKSCPSETILLRYIWSGDRKLQNPVLSLAVKAALAQEGVQSSEM